MTEQALRARFPEISWDEPVQVTVPPGGGRWVCRLCIATHGLRAADLYAGTGFVFESRAEALAHIAEHEA